MNATLRRLWQSRAPRDRMVIAVLAVLVGVTLYVWLVQSADQAHRRLRASVPVLRAQAARLDQHAAEIGRLRSAPPPSASTTDLRTLVQAQAGAAGLSGALGQINVTDDNQVVVVFGAVSFADWLNWVASLKSQQVRLDACRVEALSSPGLVSVTATLVRSKPR
ncbi:MAG TPA: type II secretion system protein M [Burkholderiales bacterium]|nr:type II secretion system protein M [Burkholderiales bacterium]